MNENIKFNITDLEVLNNTKNFFDSINENTVIENNQNNNYNKNNNYNQNNNQNNTKTFIPKKNNYINVVNKNNTFNVSRGIRMKYI
tara:strand:+ start:536 stop:793 length:258 start_codon:yes stop_codon:yes gene_type:complete